MLMVNKDSDCMVNLYIYIYIIELMAGWCFGTFFHILGIIIPTEFHIFQRVGIPPTRN